MTPYRTRACVEPQDPNGAQTCAEQPFGTGGCPSCGVCIDGARSDARRGARRSRWTMALGALAALALLMTTVAALRAIQVATRAMHRMDRREAHQAKVQVDAYAKLIRAAQKKAQPPPPKSRHARGQGLVTQALATCVERTNIAPEPSASAASTTTHLPTSFGATHDPLELRRRADWLGHSGNIRVMRVRVSGVTAKQLLASDPRSLVLSPHKFGPSTLGVKIDAMPAPLAVAGLRIGDEIVTVNGTYLKSAADLVAAIRPTLGASPRLAVLELHRDGAPMILEVTLTD